jgi:hypothetical protein
VSLGHQLSFRVSLAIIGRDASPPKLMVMEFAVLFAPQDRVDAVIRFGLCLPVRPGPFRRAPSIPHEGGDMPKLKLDVDALEIQSFDTGMGDRAVGTVQAHATTIQPNDSLNACDPAPTYQAGSCNGGVCTDDYTCQESWAEGCQSDPTNGWTTLQYGC